MSRPSGSPRKYRIVGVTSTTDARACWRAARDRGAVGEKEPVRRRLVRAADLRVADHPLDQPLAEAERLHAVAGHHDQQRSSGPIPAIAAADRLVDDRIMALEHRAEPPTLLVGDVAEFRRHGIAQEVVADRIEALISRERHLGRPRRATSPARCDRRCDRCAPASACRRLVKDAAPATHSRPAALRASPPPWRRARPPGVPAGRSPDGSSMPDGVSATR